MDPSQEISFLNVYGQFILYTDDLPYKDDALEAFLVNRQQTDDTDIIISGIPFDRYLLTLASDKPLYWIISNVGQGQLQNFIIRQAGGTPWPTPADLLYKGYGYAQEVFTIKDSIGNLKDVILKSRDAFKVNLNELSMDNITAIPKNFKKARNAIKNIGKSYEKLTTNIKNLAKNISTDVEEVQGLLDPEPAVFSEQPLKINLLDIVDEDLQIDPEIARFYPQSQEPTQEEIDRGNPPNVMEEEPTEVAPKPAENISITEDLPVTGDLPPLTPQEDPYRGLTREEWMRRQEASRAAYDQGELSFNEGALGEARGGGYTNYLTIEDLNPRALDFYYSNIPPGIHPTQADLRFLDSIDWDLWTNPDALEWYIVNTPWDHYNVQLSQEEVQAINKLDFKAYNFDSVDLLSKLETHTLVPRPQVYQYGQAPDVPLDLEANAGQVNLDEYVTRQKIIELVNRPNNKLTPEEWKIVIKRMNDLDIQVSELSNAAPEAQIESAIEATMNSIVDEGVGAEALYGTLLAEEGAELIASILNPAFFALNAIFFAVMVYALYKRLKFTWQAGGVIIPLYPPPWLFDWNKLTNKSVTLPQDVDLCFDREALKRDPSGYFKQTLSRYLQKKGTSDPFKEGVEWQYLTVSHFFAYKRDPRQDNQFSFSDLSPHKFFVNNFEGWIQWRCTFNPPISPNMANQAKYNIILAMFTIFGIDYPMNLKAGPALPTIDPNDSVKYYDPNHKTKLYTLNQIWKGADVQNWDLVLGERKNWHSQAPIKEFRYNSGINITLVSPIISQFRRLFHLVLRSEDYWYLLANLSKTDETKKPWKYDSRNEEWVLKTQYQHIARGAHSIRLVTTGGVTVPLATGTIPTRYWVLTPQDTQIQSSEIPDDGEGNVTGEKDLLSEEELPENVPANTKNQVTGEPEDYDENVAIL